MKLLLLVQNQTDVDNLKAAASAILRSAITGVWVVFSPAITVNSSEAAAKFDAEIEQLRTAERQAAERGDYEAAGGYKVQREGKELDRAKALRDAWKTASEEDRKTRTKEIFQPFTDTLNKAKLSVRVTGHSDHYERDQWVALLNSLSGVWFKPFEPGSFVTAWPESVVSSIAAVKVVSEKAAFEVKVATPDVPATPKTREQELSSMKYMSLKAVAKKAGVDTTGKKVPQIVAEILASEAAPALSEY